MNVRPRRTSEPPEFARQLPSSITPPRVHNGLPTTPPPRHTPRRVDSPLLPTKRSQSKVAKAGTRVVRQRQPGGFSRDAKASLISLIVHTVLLLVLLPVVILLPGNAASTLVINSRIENNQTAQPEFKLTDSSDQSTATLTPSSDPSNAAIPTNLSLTQNQIASGSQLPSLQPPENVTSTSVMASLLGEDLSILAPSGPVFAETTLTGRSGVAKMQNVLANGGSKQTEEAVEAALIWLKNHQFTADSTGPDGSRMYIDGTPRRGSWSLMLDHSDCKGQCRNPEEMFDPKPVAATGLALLAFLGAGHTHREGPYRIEVYEALQWLTQSMKVGPPTNGDRRVDGQFVPDQSRHMMYEQGIAAFALCEAYQMTGDKMLEPYCQRAVNFIHKAQVYNGLGRGSWGYRPQTPPGDLSIVAWQMMALRSAASAKLSVPAGEIRLASEFLDSQMSDNNRYGYRNKNGLPEMTAIGGLMRLMTGWSRTDSRIRESINYVCYRGTPDLHDDGPEATDFYFNYYASNFLFYAQSPLWTPWNDAMKAHLISTQEQIGHEKGSWFPIFPFGEKDRDKPASLHNQIGGRLYTTCMAALTLEVYYRYLPILKQTEEFDFKL